MAQILVVISCVAVPLKTNLLTQDTFLFTWAALKVYDLNSFIDITITVSNLKFSIQSVYNVFRIH